MSGTSVDGVDAALVEFRGRGVAVRAFLTLPYPRRVREAVFRLFDPATARVDDLCHTNFAIGECFAGAALAVCRKAGVAPADVAFIGSHGQTVWHMPDGRREGGRLVRSTLQLGEPCVIAERTGITTVADFRPRDCAAGGEGAPLVPYTDFVLFAHRRLSRAVQNIGGIANVTYLPAGGGAEGVRAFDTGPGNMIIDRLAERYSAGRLAFDRGGRMAARGRVDEGLLADLMRHPFLRRRPPKSTGREMFGAAFADALAGRSAKEGLAPEDAIATATAFTAESIADAYRRHLPGAVDEIILCGGGARNPVLVERLRVAVAPAALRFTDDFGIDADAKEAVSFAILARETLRGRPSNVPAATGAARPVVLGKIVPGGPGLRIPRIRRGR
jgi:anhydro-N-acetylmuramic acid kinase